MVAILRLRRLRVSLVSSWRQYTPGAGRSQYAWRTPKHRGRRRAL